MSLNPTNLFEGTPIITERNKIVISSNKFIYILDNITGSILHKKNLSGDIKSNHSSKLFIFDYK